MKWETNRLDEVIARTLDALRESGLNPGTVWRQYNQCYEQLRKYCCDRNTCEYDEELIHAFLHEKTKQYEQGVFKRHRWSAYHRAISVLIEYAANGELLSTFSRKRVKLILHADFETLLQQYLLTRQYHPNTQDDVIWAIRRFLYYLEQQGHYSVAAINESHVRKYLLMMSEQLSAGSIKNVMGYLRSFFAYVFQQGLLCSDFSELMSIKIHRPTKVYPILTDKEVERILAQVDTRTVMGKRDLAMLMLGLTTGLRAVDIINLRLTDIDWMRGEIRLVQKKTANPVTLPLMPQAGEALKDYILYGRPQIDSVYIFLTVDHPIRKFNDETTFGYMFSKYQRAAGIERKAFDGKGFHALRRRIATKMLITGTPVTTVAQVLGHMEISSVQQYLVFDTESLRRCALDLTGIEMKGGMFDA